MTQSRFFREECYIGGEWRGGKKTIAVTNPANGETVGHVPDLGREDAKAAIAAAHKAFPAWRATTAEERGKLCRAFYEALMDNQQTPAELRDIENKLEVKS